VHEEHQVLQEDLKLTRVRVVEYHTLVLNFHLVFAQITRAEVLQVYRLFRLVTLELGLSLLVVFRIYKSLLIVFLQLILSHY
jgi:hypothetical protein